MAPSIGPPTRSTRPLRSNAVPMKNQTNGVTSQRTQTQTQLQRKSSGSNGWAEPPARTPQPSFMDHNLERQGVLEQMVTLGTFPTTKVKARSKGSSTHKLVQARNLEDMVVDDGADTPDVLTNSEFGVDGQQSPFMQVDDEDDVFGGSIVDSKTHKLDKHITMQAAAPSSSPQAEPKLRNRSISYSSPISRALPTRMQQGDILYDGIMKLTQWANEHNDTSTEQMVMHISSAANHDDELAQLLRFALTNNSINERGSALNRKLKELRKNLRINGFRSDSTKRPNSARTPPQFLNYNNAALSSHSTTPFSPTPIYSSPANMHSHPKPTSNANDTIENANLNSSKKRKGISGKLSRRMSSSSLSSVDEGLAAGPPPSIEALSGDPVKPLARKSSQVHDENNDLEAARKRLKPSVEDVAPTESKIRQSLRLTRNGKRNSLAPEQKPKVETPTPQNGFVNPSTILLAPTVPTSNATGLKRPATPPLGRPPAKKAKKKAKTKMSPKKAQPQIAFAGIARTEPKRHDSTGCDEENSNKSDNDDYCTTCSGTGYLLCCDGCDRAFHFTCLDPPLHQETQPTGPWLCWPCRLETVLEFKQEPSLFGELLKRIDHKNPCAFNLPAFIRDHFVGVKTGDNGEYVEVSDMKPNSSRRAPDDNHNYTRLFDKKGQVILCYSCHKSSLDGRSIIPCDYCSEYWHLDCLDPPLANPPFRGWAGKFKPSWMCPLHIEHDLRKLDPIEPDGVRHDYNSRAHRVRRPKVVKVAEPRHTRGFKNNGLIEVGSDSDDGPQWDEEEAPDGVVYKLPAKSIKLDFIAKVKSQRIDEANRMAHQAAKLELERQQTELEKSRLALLNEQRLARDISRRNAREQVAALALMELATGPRDTSLRSNEVENLLYTLEANAPPEVVEAFAKEEADRAAATNIGITSNTNVLGNATANPRQNPPPSPPTSSDQVGTEGPDGVVSGKSNGIDASTSEISNVIDSANSIINNDTNNVNSNANNIAKHNGSSNDAQGVVKKNKKKLDARDKQTLLRLQQRIAEMLEGEDRDDEVDGGVN